MLANIITGLRILASLVLLFCPVFTSIFYVVYLVSGFSDMADGIIARKTLTLSIVPIKYSGIPICLVATFAAVQEGYFVRIGRNIQ